MEKRVLSDERRAAVNMIAIRKWVLDYNTRHGKDPSRADIFIFIQALNERAIININTDLAELNEEELEIREIALDMCKVQNCNPDWIRIMLTPNPSWSFRVQGGTPSEIYIGIRRKTPGFKLILAEAIRRAKKLYKPSSLIPMSKVLEYRHETRKIRKLSEDTEHYPLPDISRLRVREYRTLEVFDTKTGESAKVTQEISLSQFKHYLNDRQAHEGKLVLAKQMLAKGLIEFTHDEDDDTEENTE